MHRLHDDIKQAVGRSGLGPEENQREGGFIGATEGEAEGWQENQAGRLQMPKKEKVFRRWWATLRAQG